MVYYTITFPGSRASTLTSTSSSIGVLRATAAPSHSRSCTLGGAIIETTPLRSVEGVKASMPACSTASIGLKKPVVAGELHRPHYELVVESSVLQLQVLLEVCSAEEALAVSSALEC